MAGQSENGEEQEFEEFVQKQVQQQGFVLTEEEDKMVQDAIAKTLAENKDRGPGWNDFKFEDAEEVNEVFDKKIIEKVK